MNLRPIIVNLLFVAGVVFVAEAAALEEEKVVENAAEVVVTAAKNSGE